MKNLFDFDPNIPDTLDGRKKYHGTVVLVNGVPHTMGCGDLSATFQKMVVGTESTKLPEEFVVPYNHDLEDLVIEPWLPDSGWVYDRKGLLVYVKQMPARQWRRSYCNDNYNIVMPYTAREIRGANVRPDFQMVIQQLFSPPSTARLAPGFEKALHKKYSGVAINNLLALSRYEEDTWALLSPEGVVGYVNPSRNQIYISKISRQEILDITRGIHTWNISAI